MRVCLSRQITSNESLFENSDYRDYDRRIESIGFPIEVSTTNVKPTLKTLMEEIKLIVVKKCAFKDR